MVQKARLDDFAIYIDSHCPIVVEYFFLSLFAAALFTSLALNAAKSSIHSGRVKRNLKLGGLASGKRNAFAYPHRSDEKRLAYASAPRHALSAIAKPKVNAWH